MLFHLQSRHAVVHPVRRRLPLQEMIEPFLHAHRVVLLVDRPCQAVVFTDVLQQHHILAQLAQRVVVGHALIEIHRAVAIVVQDHERNVHVIRKAIWRVAQIGVRIARIAGGEPTLARDEDALIGIARVPVHGAEHRYHVSQWRTGDGRFEDVRLGRDETGLVSAPAVTLQRDVGRIHDAAGDRRLHRRHHAPDGRAARIVEFVRDVGHEVGVAA